MFSCGGGIVAGCCFVCGLLRAILGGLGGFVLGGLFALRIAWVWLRGCVLYMLRCLAVDF